METLQLGVDDARVRSHGAPVALAWAAMLVASGLPEIALYLANQTAPAWLDFARIGVLTLLFGSTRLFPALARARGLVLTALALSVGWAVLPLAQSTPQWSSWMEGRPAHVQMLARSFLQLLPSALIVLSTIGSGLGRRDLFLAVGDLRAPAQLPWRGKPLTWARLGPGLVIIAAVGLSIQLWFTVHPDPTMLARAAMALPMALAFAAVNAFTEEVSFRCVFLARGIPVLGRTQTFLYTSVLFGLAHWFGHPSGPTGVVLAGVIAWVWAKGLVETRGLFWTWAFHAVMDVVIFSMVVMAA